MTASGAQARQAASWSRAILVPMITQQGPLSGRVRNSLNALACEISTEPACGSDRSWRLPERENARESERIQSSVFPFSEGAREPVKAR